MQVEMGQPPPLEEPPPMDDEPYPRGWEEDVLISTLRTHGLMLEEILKRLPPAPGGEGGHRPGTLLALGLPRAAPLGGARSEEKLAEPASGDSTGGGEQRTGERSAESFMVHEVTTGSSMSAAAPGVEEPESKSRFKKARGTLNRMSHRVLRPKKAGDMDSVFRHVSSDMPRNRVSMIIQQFVMNPAFELLFGMLILVNTLFMVVEEQYKGAQIGHDLGLYSHYGSDEWADSTYNESMFEIVEVIFCVIFTVEVILRMAGMGILYFKRPSEYFDLAVVILSDLSIIFSTARILENVQLMRLLRAAKLLRLLKLVRTIEGFDALSLMTTALHSSSWALWWSILLLLSIQTFLAMIATEFFRVVYLEGDILSDDEKDDLFEYWGTFTRSILSLFELALANWPPICRWLVENLHEGFMVPVLSFKLVMGIAVIGVINAVFMQETFKVANTDDDIMVRQKTRAAKQHSDKMEALFQAADKDGSGHIDRSECRAILKNKSIKAWLASMDLVATDADLDLVFDLLRGHDDFVTKRELIQGMNKLKGPARSIDMRRLLHTLQEHSILAASPRGSPSPSASPRQQLPRVGGRRSSPSASAASPQLQHPRVGGSV